MGLRNSSVRSCQRSFCDRYELTCRSEFARDLLELVVDGPEMDEIYGAYQWEDSPAASNSLQTSGSLTQDEDALMDDL